MIYKVKKTCTGGSPGDTPTLNLSSTPTASVVTGSDVRLDTSLSVLSSREGEVGEFSKTCPQVPV